MNADDSSFGWRDSPDGRGTFDIIKTCLVTILLCCWTTVNPNIPGPTDGKWQRILDKVRMASIGLLGPEFLLVIASAQRDSARRSVEAFKKKGLRDWTLQKGFYADMGGFLLVAPDYTFPVDAKQLLYLVDNGYVDYPTISEDDIDDRNKADSAARFIALTQAIWFIANTIARASQHLTITTLELTTASFVIVTFGSSYYWFWKPMDVISRTLLECNVPTSRIREKADIQGPWVRTPLDFISRDEVPESRVWQYCNDILHRLHIPLFNRKVKESPWNRIPSDTIHKQDLRTQIITGGVSLAFAAVFLFAWNFHFPTKAEQILWRTASICNVACVIVGAIIVAPWYFLPFARKHAAAVDAEYQQHRETSRSWQFRLRNISSPKDPALTLPLSLMAPASIVCVLYSICRIYILIEGFISLRTLPSSTFETVSWSKYLLHL